jgi:putative PEP-CTERM system histidine kinase
MVFAPAMEQAMTPYGLRRRFRHFLGRHRVSRKYDYREHWMAFTSRMSGMHRTGDIGGPLAEDVVRASGATCAAVYISDASETAYRLSGSVGSSCFAQTIEDGAAVPSWLRMHASPVHLPAKFLSSITLPVMSTALGVAIPWRGTLLGFIVLGPQKTGVDYTAEDHEFLRTVAEQAAVSITAVRLAEAAEWTSRAEPAAGVTPAVIHDIKNSVSALSLLATNAGKHLAEPEFQRDAIVTLSRTVERMRHLLGKLTATRAEAPRTAEPIDLRELIIEATTPLAADGKVRLVRRLSSVARVYGDRDALLRIVENLTTNAAEAIDREGTVTVTLGEEQGYAVISVADTGCGISEEYKERHLFSPFRSTKKGGWGVGLYQTKQVVESQDGEIIVESLEGRGTTFTVKLPLRTDVESGRLESVR